MGNSEIVAGMICSNCGTELTWRHKICPSCKLRLGDSAKADAYKKCTACGERFADDEDKRRCISCGNRVGETVYKCNNCGRVYESEPNYCGTCSNEMAYAREEVVKKTKWTPHSHEKNGTNRYCTFCRAELE